MNNTVQTTAEVDPLAPVAPSPESDFTNLVKLMSALALVRSDLGALQFHIDKQMHATIEDARPAFAQRQEREAALEVEIETIVRRNPEWFCERKSISLPAGTCAVTASAALVATHEEFSIALVREVFADRAHLFIRQKEELNLEALETLSDEDLAKIEITRLRKTNVTIKISKVNLGKGKAKAATEGGAK